MATLMWFGALLVLVGYELGVLSGMDAIEGHPRRAVVLVVCGAGLVIGGVLLLKGGG